MNHATPTGSLPGARPTAATARIQAVLFSGRSRKSPSMTAQHTAIDPGIRTCSRAAGASSSPKPRRRLHAFTPSTPSWSGSLPHSIRSVPSSLAGHFPLIRPPPRPCLFPLLLRSMRRRRTPALASHSSSSSTSQGQSPGSPFSPSRPRQQRPWGLETMVRRFSLWRLGLQVAALSSRLVTARHSSRSQPQAGVRTVSAPSPRPCMWLLSSMLGPTLPCLFLMAPSATAALQPSTAGFGFRTWVRQAAPPCGLSRHFLALFSRRASIANASACQRSLATTAPSSTRLNRKDVPCNNWLFTTLGHCLAYPALPPSVNSSVVRVLN
eukprot:m.29600 g.29600  ORF g.29600 m.29600 type:complete len:324 (+) comp5113_c0_seq1:1147-2118(+)